jgi:hypothetical protein
MYRIYESWGRYILTHNNVFIRSFLTRAAAEAWADALKAKHQ